MNDPQKKKRIIINIYWSSKLVMFHFFLSKKVVPTILGLYHFFTSCLSGFFLWYSPNSRQSKVKKLYKLKDRDFSSELKGISKFPPSNERIFSRQLSLLDQGSVFKLSLMFKRLTNMKDWTEKTSFPKS